MVKRRDEIVVEESQYLIHSKQHARRKFVAEGSATSISRNLGPSYITPFALAIGANSAQIGFLSSFAGLFSPLGQLFGSKMMEKQTRRTIVARSLSIQILFWLPIISLSYFSWKGIGSQYLPYFLIAFFSIFIFAQGMKHPAWFSWIGDLVPEKERGKYFSKRNRTNGILGLTAFFIAAFLLDYFKTRGLALLGFSIIFVMSLFFREASHNFLRKIFSPKFKLKKGYYFSFWSFLKTYDNYGKFAVFQAAFYFSVMISAPFFAVYMLENLEFSYVTFTTVSMSSMVFYLLFVPLAGKFSDRYGNLKLFYVAGFLFPIVPLLWIFLKTPFFLILFPGVISGIANSAFIMSVTNFTYDSVSPQRRGLCVAYSSLLTGIGIFLGSVLGGLLIQYSNITFMEPIFFVFLLSSILIFISSLIFLPHIKEIKKTEKMKGFSVDVQHPFKTVQSDVVWFKNFFKS